MKTRALGSSGIEAPVVALGTWALGGWMWGGTDRNDPVPAIHAAIDQGMTMIDTAPIYGFGLSEELVGRAISDRRDRVILATKCGLVWDEEAGDFYFESEGRRVCKYLAPASIRREIEASLKRLNVDTIDLYQTHWQESTTPIEDTMTELLRLKDEGKIRAIGTCNAEIDHLEAYRRAGPLDSDQEKYSMLDREKDAQLPRVQQQGLAFLSYSTLALGLLTGKIGPDRTFPESDLRSRNPRFKAASLQRVHAMLEELRPITESFDLSLAQLAIAWTLARPGVTHALVGARTPEQAAENARAGDVDLSASDMERINAILARHAGDIP